MRSYSYLLGIIIEVDEVVLEFTFERMFVNSLDRLINRIPNFGALKSNSKFTIICSNFWKVV